MAWANARSKFCWPAAWRRHRASRPWFEWLGIDAHTEIPTRWPEDYRQIVQRSVDSDRARSNIGLSSAPNCKRRWEHQRGMLEQAALRDWLLARLESPRSTGQSPDKRTPQLIPPADWMITARDAEFMQIAELYAGHADFDLNSLSPTWSPMKQCHSCPCCATPIPACAKRAQWEDAWKLQRREDAGEDVGKISVPLQVPEQDFLKSDFWRLRGGLDVPKERWISYPGCERGADGSLVIAWAGWDHLQQATALATYFIDMKEREGWSRERLQPLLAGLLELVPWLKQWHNDMNPDFGARMGDYYESFVTDEARALQFTLDDLRAWKPAATTAKRGRKKSA
jgi:hypothetical protein